MISEKRITVAWAVGDTLKAVGVVVLAALVLVGSVLFCARNLELSVSQRQIIGIIASILLEIVLFASAWFFGPRKYGQNWRALGYQLASGCWGIPTSIGVLALGLLTNTTYVLIIRLVGLETILPPPVSPLFSEGLSGFLVAAVPASLFAPVAEETFFRGFFFPGLRPRFGGFGAAVIANVLFALGHLQIGTMIPIFVFGMLLVWLYSTTKSIWPCILTHSLFNTLALLVAYFVPIVGGQ